MSVKVQKINPSAHSVVFSVFGIPQTKGSTRAFIPKGWNRPVITNDNPKNKSWAALVRAIAQSHMIPGMPWRDAVELRLFFRIRRPQSVPKSRHGFPITRPDLDKLERSVKDALTGVIYMDDAQVCDSIKYKRYSDRPGVDIKVTNWVIVNRNFERKN